jgi:molybdopterin converting factor small subunit
VNVRVRFYSFFKDLTGQEQIDKTLPDGSRIADLLELLFADFPELAGMRRSILIAVGVDYQKPAHLLQEGDEVSLFPPVQGG